MPYNDEKLLEIANSHGYFLQQAIEYTVHSGARDRSVSWRVASTEHYWENTEAGSKGYADMIIEDDELHTVGVVECKRYSEDTPWLFLCPNQNNAAQKESNLFWIYNRGSRGYPRGNHGLLHEPVSYEAKFCVVNNGQNAQRQTVESIAGTLMYSVEAIAAQYALLGAGSGFKSLVFVPIIVTTAKLYVCKYRVQSLDRESGRLTQDKAGFEQVEYVRFKKVFTASSAPIGETDRFSQIEERQAQTVLIVSASRFSSLLTKLCNMRPSNLERIWPWGEKMAG